MGKKDVDILNWNLLKILTIVIFIMVSLSGCNEQSIDESDDSENEQSPPLIQSFSSNKTEITTGETINLSWSVKDSTTVTLIPSAGSVSSQGSIEVRVNQSTTYTLIAENNVGNVTETIDIIVYASNGEEAPEIYFSAGYEDNYLLVTFVSDNISWSDIQLNGQDITENNLDVAEGNVTGIVQRGDRLINLIGDVTLTWKPTNQQLGHWTFT